MGELNPKAYPFIFKETIYGKKREAIPMDLAFHGTNLRNVTVLVDDAERVHKGLEFILLKNILKALDLSENDVAILDAHAPGSELNNIKQQLEPKVILSFGEGFPQTAGKKNTLFEKDGIRILVTDKLHALEASTELKLGFWRELKKLKERLKQT